MKIELNVQDFKNYCESQKNDFGLDIPSEALIEKTEKIYNEVIFNIKQSGKSKNVISLYGGSGVGKTTISTLLNYVFIKNGINSFVISGDNYPHRIPKSNDAERLRTYRENGLKGLVYSEDYTEECMKILKDLLTKDLDFDTKLTEKYSWLKTYQEHGRKALEKYLGTNDEIDFGEISDLLTKFKNNDKEIYVKSLGRNENDVYYSKVDFSNIEVIILEWTHGNNESLIGVDYPIFLMSTPEETLEWRKKRNRDNGIGNPFTNQVLEIEQKKLNNQSRNAKLIVSQSGDFLTLEEFEKLL